VEFDRATDFGRRDGRGGLTRREVSALLVAAALQPVMLDVSCAAATGSVCFIAQSGHLRDGTVYLGLLVSGDRAGDRRELARLREELGHRRMLKADSTDRYGAAFCERFVDYMLASRHLRFVGASVTTAAVRGKARERDPVAAGYYARLLAQALPAGGDTPQIELRDRNDLRTRAIAGAIARTRRREVGVRAARDEDMIQLAGYLANALRPAGGKVRRGFQEYLKAKLGVPALDEEHLGGHARFSVRAIAA
jgi:hypothetical protein